MVIEEAICCFVSIGMESHKLPSKDQPSWSPGISELCDCVTWWLSVCIWWQGWHGDAVGLKWRKTPVHTWGRWYLECPVLQPQQILAVCSRWTHHQGLGSWEQVACRWAATRCYQHGRQGPCSWLCFSCLVSWWPDSVCGLHRQPDPCVASHSALRWTVFAFRGILRL